MRGMPRPTQTPGRHAWLRKLDRQPGTVRQGQGPTAWSCMALGWTEWVTPYRPKGGERLTDAGRAVLARWNGEADAPPAPRLGPKDRAANALAAIPLELLADLLVASGRDRDLVVLLADRAPQPIVAVREVLDRHAAAVELEPASEPAPTPRYHAGGPGGVGLHAGEVPARLGPAYALCPRCTGKGSTGHFGCCARCGGTGKVAREVAPL